MPCTTYIEQHNDIKPLYNLVPIPGHSLQVEAAVGTINNPTRTYASDLHRKVHHLRKTNQIFQTVRDANFVNFFAPSEPLLHLS